MEDIRKGSKVQFVVGRGFSTGTVVDFVVAKVKDAHGKMKLRKVETLKLARPGKLLMALAVAFGLCLAAPAHAQPAVSIYTLCGIGEGQAATQVQMDCLVRTAQAQANAAAVAVAPVVAAPVLAPIAANKAFVMPTIPTVKTGDVPDPEKDPMGFVAKVGGLIAAHQYWALIPLFLIGLVAAVRKFGAKWFGGFFGTGRGGAVLMLIGCFGGALFLAITSGLTGFAQVTIAALGILVTAYPLLKIIGNLVSGTAEAQTVENALVAVGKDAAVNPIAPVAPADLAKAVADAKATGFVADPKLSATDIANAATKP